MSCEGDDLSAETRLDLIRLCGKPRARTFEWSPDGPTVWQPTTVIDPRTDFGICFSDLSAWHYIAELLESGVIVRTRVLDKPRGAIGYEIKVDLQGRASIYIKLQLRGGQVIGRSFHNSAPL